MKTNRRIEQVNDFLRNEVAQLIRQEQDKMRLKLVSVTEVQTSPDLRHAKVFVSTLGGAKERDAAVATLRRHASHLRHLLAPSITFRTVPTLDFYPDSSLETGAEILRTLNEIERERALNPPRLDDEPAVEVTEKVSNPRARKRRTED